VKLKLVLALEQIYESVLGFRVKISRGSLSTVLGLQLVVDLHHNIIATVGSGSVPAPHPQCKQ
jgi:hypothetical protein